MLIEIAIPVLNEESTLERQISKADDFLRANLSDLGSLKLVIADNGSTDQTAMIATRLASNLDTVCLRQVAKPGVGLALKTAWSNSNADIVGYMDLDLATDLNHLREALEPLIEDRADIVAGSRLKRGAKVIGREPFRELTSRAFNKIVQTYLRASFTDGMCGFKFLQRKHVRSLVDAGAISDGWFFATELLVCAERLGLRIVDLPVTWTDSPNSKVKVGKLSIEYLRAMGSLRARLRATPPR